MFAVSSWLLMLVPFALLSFWVLRGFYSSSFRWTSSRLHISALPWVVMRYFLWFLGDYPPSSPSPTVITHMASLVWCIVATYSFLVCSSGFSFIAAIFFFFLALPYSPSGCGSLSICLAAVLSLSRPSYV